MDLCGILVIWGSSTSHQTSGRSNQTSSPCGKEKVTTNTRKTRVITADTIATLTGTSSPDYDHRAITVTNTKRFFPGEYFAEFP